MNIFRTNKKGRAFIRLAAYAFAVIMLLTVIAGCKKAPDSLYEAPEFVYVAQSVPLPSDLGDVGNLVFLNDKVYFTVNVSEQGDEKSFNAWTNTTYLYAMNSDGTGITRLANYIPPVMVPDGASGGCYINRIHVDGDNNLWVVEQWDIYGFNLPPDFDEENDFAWNYYESLDSGTAVRMLDSDGAELMVLDIEEIAGKQDYFYISAFCVDGAGNVYLAADDWEKGGRVIYVFDANNNLHFTLSTDSWFNQFIRMSDGTVVFIANVANDAGTWTNMLQKIDYAAKAMGESVEIPDVGWDYYPGGSEYDILISDYNNIFGYKLGAEEPEKLLNWIDSDVINNGVQNITMTADNRIICTNWYYDRASSESGYELLFLTKTPYDELPQKTVITLATLYSGYYRDAVVSFNKTNPNYRISVIDYSQYNNEDDWNAGLTRLSTELITGKVPDILDVSGVSYKQYAARGLLADLYTFIDSDPDYERNSFVTGAFKAAEIEGKLYQVFPSFSVNTIAGHPSVLGKETGWNMEEFVGVMNAHPEADMPLGQWLTKTSFLQAAVSFGIDEYINWGTGKASFDNPDFIRLLEFANTMPGDIDWEEMRRSGRDYEEVYVPQEEAIATGRQIMVQMQVYDYYDFQWTKAMFGGELVFKGFPNESRNGNSLSVNNGLAIIEKSPNKDAAWAFVRTILDKDWQLNYSWGLMTNKAAFDTRVKEAMERDYGDGPGGPGLRPMQATDRAYYEPQVQKLTQADVDQMNALIDSATGTAGWNIDQQIWDIINEEVSGYFSGSGNAADAAKYIQNRVQTLVSERS